MHQWVQVRRRMDLFCIHCGTTRRRRGYGRVMDLPMFYLLPNGRWTPKEPECKK
jgi:hypothetical protein